MKINKLTPEEEKIIVHKGTEPPFSGEYDNFFEEGVYACKRCGAPLYRSENKFDAKCGWPSFDQEIPGAVKRTPDPDGVRTEISCARCGAHLGHVFKGEGFTPKNVRHCVNSLSMKFIPKESESKKTLKSAVFGGGCFWCTEAIFSELRGVEAVTSGYSGGDNEREYLTYEEVSTGKTGYAEVVKIDFDPGIISYETLLDVFFHTHDPTSINRQGGDIGPQYRSIILYFDEEQKKQAERFIKKLEESKEFKKPIVAELKPFKKFHEVSDYHQHYYAKNPQAPYCQLVIAPKIKEFRERHNKLLK